MASVKVEFELKGGDKVVTTNEKIIKQLQEQGVAYQVLEGQIDNTTEAYNESVDTQLQGNEELNKSYKDFIREIKSAEKELKVLEATGQQNSERYRELVGRVAQFKDAQEEVGRRLNANKSGADAFIGSVAGITGGFAAAQGAFALFGAESENVQKALLKVQAALSLAQGIEQIKDAKGAFESLGKTIGGAVVNAFSTLKGAILSTGIGALVVTIGLLAARLNDVKTSAQDVKFELDEIEKKYKALDDAKREGERLDKEIFEAQNGRLAFLRDEYQRLATTIATGVITEEERENLKKRQILLNLEIREIEKQQEEQRNNEAKAREEEALRVRQTNARRRVEILEDGLKKELAELKLKYDEERRLAIQNGESLLVLDELYQKNRNTIIQNSLDKLQNSIAENQDEFISSTFTQFQKEKNEITKNYDERIRIEKEFQIEVEKNKEFYGDRAANLIQQSQEREKAFTIKQNEELKDLAIKFRIDFLKILNELNEKRSRNNQDSFLTRKELFLLEREEFIKNQTEILKSYLSIDGEISESEEKRIKLFQDRLRRQLDDEEAYRDRVSLINRLSLEEEIKYQQAIQNRLKERNNNRIKADREIERLNNLIKKSELNNEIKTIEAKLLLYDKDSVAYKELILEKLRLQNQLAELDAKQNQNQIERLNSFIQKNQQVIQAIQQSISDLNEAFNSFYDLRLAKLEAFYDREFQLLEERKQKEIDNYALTQEEIQNINERYALEETALEEKKQREIKEIEKKRANDQLAFTLAQIIANQSLAIVRALAELGPIAGPIAAAAVGISTAAQVAAAINQRNLIVKYEKGGILNGMSHAQGGILAGGVELEGGEAVINRRSTAQFAPLLSAINVAGGGRAFTTPNLTGNLNLNPNPNTQSIARILDRMATQRAYILSDDVQSDTARVDRIRRISTF